MKIILLFFSLLVLEQGCRELFAQTFDEQVALSFKNLSEDSLFVAETSLKTALKMEPANPLNVMLLSNLGTIQRRQKKNAEALTSYTAALGRAPKSIILLSNRASLFAEMNQPENSIMDYTSLLMINDKNEEALYQRGLLYLQVKHFDLGQSDFERILELNPKTITGRIGITSLYKLQGKYEEAETIYFYLMDHSPESPDLYAGRAELYTLMKKSGKAIDDINRAIRLREGQSPNPYFYVIRSRIKTQQYDHDAALSDMEMAKKLGYKEK